MVNSLLPLTLLALAANGGSPSELEYSGRDGNVTVPTPMVARAEIRIDSRLDEAVWEQAALLSSFTQYDPLEGVEASQRTEVRVLMDADAIYFGVQAFDTHPGGIRATLAERDEFTRSDDFIRIILDTFDDQRRGYAFSVNPLGVQHDGIWNEGGSAGRRGGHGPPIDDNPDFLWESHGELTEWGYALEIRIPLKSLRFPQSESQDWGLQVIRRIQRNGYESSWAPITGDVSNQLAQAGKLTGIRGLDPGMMMEINPVLTGKRLGSYDDEAGVFVRDDPQGDFGLNLSYGLTSNLTLDATYNPDFSQIEADAGQIAVNERFALFFPEKRPFFLEGTEIFGLPKQLVYTRSIANPIAGAKLTGKVGSFNMGYIGAVDESLGDDPNTLVNLVRLRKDLGEQSTIGGVYTDRTVDSDQFNRVVGADARLIFARSYTLTLMGAGSFTGDGDEDGTRAGRLLNARLEKSGREFSYNLEFEDTDHDFDAGSGFFRRVGDTQVQGSVNLGFFGDAGSFVESFRPGLQAQGYWDHEDFWDGNGMEEAELQLSARLSLRGNITLFGNFQAKFYSFDANQYDGLTMQVGGVQQPYFPQQDLFQGLYSSTLGVWFSRWERVRGNIRGTLSKTPIFDRRLGVPVELGNRLSSEGELNLFPTRHLKMDVGLRYARIHRATGGGEYSSALIPRIQAQYQFSRSFFIRGIFEYSAQSTNRLQTPGGLPLFYCDEEGCETRDGSDDNDVHLEGLVTYEPSPGTVFYIGYSRQMAEPDAFRFRNVRAEADGLFVKISYRFRM